MWWLKLNFIVIKSSFCFSSLLAYIRPLSAMGRSQSRRMYHKRENFDLFIASQPMCYKQDKTSKFTGFYINVTCKNSLNFYDTRGIEYGGNNCVFKTFHTHYLKSMFSREFASLAPRNKIFL